MQIDFKGTQDPQQGKEALTGTTEEIAQVIRAFVEKASATCKSCCGRTLPKRLQQFAAVLEDLDRG